MKTLLCVLAAVSPMATFAQFDFGGGGDGTPPWKQGFALNPKTRVKLNFQNSGIDMIVSFFSKTSGITIVKDPNLTGTLTVTSAKPVTLGEAFQILSTTLGLKGYEIRKDANLLVIQPKQTRQQGGASSISPEFLTQMMDRSQPQLKVYTIQYANASQVARVVNDVFSTTQNPADQLQQLLGGGNPQFGGGIPGGNGGNRGGRGGRGGQPAQGGNAGFRGFRGFGGAQQQSAVRASSDDFSNSVIVNAPSREQQQVEDLIRQLDRQTDQPQQSRVFKLQFASSDDLAPVVQNVLTSNAPRGKGGIGTQNVPIEQRFQQAARFGSASAAFGQVVSEPRTNSLVVTATEENLKLVEQVVKELDTEVKVENTTFVFTLSNARADQMATLLQQAFGTRQGVNGGGNVNRNQTTANRNTNANRNTQNRNRNNGGGGGAGNRGGLQSNQISDDGKEIDLALEDPNSDEGALQTMVAVQQGGGFGQFFGGQNRGRQGTTGQSTGRDENGRLVNIRDLTGQVTVIPDVNTNSLIVVTTPENAELIQSILAQLDKIPEQVMIETMIVEATLDSSSKLGVEWNFSSSHNGVTNSVGTGFGVQNPPSGSGPVEGLKYTLAGGNLSAFVNAIQSDNRFQVLSTPRIFTSNNVEAQINISQSIPYVLSQREDANGNLTFNYTFQDVGIVLTVTPRITSNGYVTMDVNQTANDLQGYTSFNAPIINQRQADTTVSVKDGETIILGGIIRNNVTTSVKKIPLLGDIPLLGQIFRSNSKTNTKTELLVFMTPRIVRDPDEARRLREEQVKGLAKPTQKTINDNLKTTPPPVDPDKGKGKVPPPGDPDKGKSGGTR